MEENSKFENFDTIDVSKDSMDVINKVLIPRMETLLDSMEDEKHLCDEFSAGIVAEFLFKGSKTEVKYKLKRLIEFRKSNPYEEKDRDDLNKQAFRFMDYVKMISSNPIRTKIRELNIRLWATYRNEIQDDIDKLKEQLDRNHIMKHNKKECICYNNY